MATLPERLVSGQRTAGPDRRAPDPRALALAGELQEGLPDAQVLLFGSRAMGDWRPESDIDLAVIGGDADAAEERLAQLCAQVRQEGELPYTQLFHFTRAEFDECRTSLPHIAGQVQRHGLTPAGEPLSRMAQTNPWPGVQKLLQSSGADLAEAIKTLGQARAPLHYAHGALEKAVKALLFAEQGDFVHGHPLEANIARLSAAMGVSLEREIPQCLRDELTRFRMYGPYAGSNPPWPATGAAELIGCVQRGCGVCGDRILSVMDKQAHEVGYEQWLNNNDALGGWATLPLDRYPQIAAMRLLLTGSLTNAHLDDIETNWLRRGTPANAMELVAAVRTNPDAWRSLFVQARNRDARTDRLPPLRDRPPPFGGG
ncbi:MAG: nucleotidyltransferase domain-containing protein [Caldilineaceae bacterium]|nr:nucleotidyltransferase domain-containing protein [Caldilineaceae bacterium]